MTTRVTVAAHPGDGLIVEVTGPRLADGAMHLIDGEVLDFYVYDDRVVTVREVAAVDILSDEHP